MKTTDEAAIIIKDVTKGFRIPLDKTSGIKQLVVNAFKRKKGYREFIALNGVSFEVKKGEFFGVVGRNGSGKSTLLKIMAGIYSPDSGGVAINGSLTPFIELGVGFNPELTGRENVFLNGALLGFSKDEMDKMYDEIVDFAELHNFMDERLKNYSSGMQVRLAFSIAIRADTDILVLDEVLAVGDFAFQQKCFEYFYELKRRGKTIILVTHDMSAVRQFCDKAVLISNGKVLQIGNPEDIAVEYDNLNSSSENNTQKDTHARGLDIVVKNKDNREASVFQYGEPVNIQVSWPKSYIASILGIIIYKDREIVFATNTIHYTKHAKSGTTLMLSPMLGNGRYKVVVGLFGENRYKPLGFFDNNVHFTVAGQPMHGDTGEEWQGLLYISNSWKRKDGQ